MRDADAKADTLFVHPDVRRMLLEAKEYFDTDGDGISRFLPLLFLSINSVLQGDTAEVVELRKSLLDWAERADYAFPFVVDPAERSPVTATIDFEGTVSASTVATALRDNGILDTEPYRKLGRNQLRIGLWPAIDTEDVEALTACIDFVVERIGN